MKMYGNSEKNKKVTKRKGNKWVLIYLQCSVKIMEYLSRENC